MEHSRPRLRGRVFATGNLEALHSCQEAEPRKQCSHGEFPVNKLGSARLNRAHLQAY